VAMRRPRSWIFCRTNIADDFSPPHVDQPHMAILTQHERGAAPARNLMLFAADGASAGTHGQGKISDASVVRSASRRHCCPCRPGGAHEIGETIADLPYRANANRWRVDAGGLFDRAALGANAEHGATPARARRGRALRWRSADGASGDDGREGESLFFAGLFEGLACRPGIAGVAGRLRRARRV